eukprot:scaffold15215_cov103-Isochrysis_galbana.AAC.8
MSCFVWFAFALCAILGPALSPRGITQFSGFQKKSNNPPTPTQQSVGPADRPQVSSAPNFNKHVYTYIRMLCAMRYAVVVVARLVVVVAL